MNNFSNYDPKLISIYEILGSYFGYKNAAIYGLNLIVMIVTIICLFLNVPLFNGFRTRSQVSLQKINLQSAQFQQQITKFQLNRDIQTAYFDCKSAFERYNANVKSVSANQEAFDYIQQRYDAGLLNIIEFTTSKNLLLVAQSNLAQARYEFILRAKVLDFYQGKPITF
jgi:outer membrane protein